MWGKTKKELAELRAKVEQLLQENLELRNQLAKDSKHLTSLVDSIAITISDQMALRTEVDALGSALLVLTKERAIMAQPSNLPN